MRYICRQTGPVTPNVGTHILKASIQPLLSGAGQTAIIQSTIYLRKQLYGIVCPHSRARYRLQIPEPRRALHPTNARSAHSKISIRTYCTNPHGTSSHFSTRLAPATHIFNPDDYQRLGSLMPTLRSKRQYKRRGWFSAERLRL